MEALYHAHPFWVWIAAAAVLLAVEVSTGSGYLLWPSGSAAVTALLTGFGLGLPAELAVFAALTIASTLLARRYLPRGLRSSGPDINDPSHRIVGHRGHVVAAFASGHGRVFIDGKEWAAELEEGEELPAGAHVRVTGVASGASLRVKPG